MKTSLALVPVGLITVLGISALPAFSVSGRSAARWPSSLERGQYRAKIASTGKVLWSVEWETRVTEAQGRPQVEIQEKGEGQPLRYKEPITWEKRMIFSVPEQAPLEVRSVEGQRWNRTGQPLSSMEVELDPQKGKIRYTDCQENRAEESAVFPWTASALPDELLFHWARTLPFEQMSQDARTRPTCTLLISPKRRVMMEARLQGTERVTTPAGTFSCYRVELSPRLMGPLKRLAPAMSLWCRTDPPHVWVRYQGPVGGPGSPQAVIELVKFDSRE